MTTTTKTAKVLNYTPEQTLEMVNLYVATPTKATVEMIAEKLGKSARSIVAKLAREKVYVAPVRTTKTGEAITKKDTLADKIGEIVGGSANDVDSLTKVNKTMLKLILDRLEYLENCRG